MMSRFRWTVSNERLGLLDLMVYGTAVSRSDTNMEGATFFEIL